jgi:hypothetical protein
MKIAQHVPGCGKLGIFLDGFFQIFLRLVRLLVDELFRFLIGVHGILGRGHAGHADGCASSIPQTLEHNGANIKLPGFAVSMECDNAGLKAGKDGAKLTSIHGGGGNAFANGCSNPGATFACILKCIIHTQLE